MGAFFAIQQPPSAARQHRALRLHQALQKQGFDQPQIIDTDFFILYLYPKHLAPQSVQYHPTPSGEFAALVGSLIYQQKAGIDALPLILAQGVDALDWNQLYGSFCLIEYRQQQLQFSLDPLGLYKVYQLADCYCSSFLALASLLERPKICQQALYEYLFQGAVHGEQSLFEAIGLLDCDRHYQWTAQGCRSIARRQHPAQIQPLCRSEAEAFELNLQALRQAFAALAQSHQGRIDTALSGGFDSRLLLALLLEQQILPDLHVYGTDQDADVQIAQQICTAQGWPLEYQDESRYPLVLPEQFAACVEQNFQHFDALPVDGIFNDGMDWQCRQQRGIAGRWMLNGGGGEIYRNFFYLAEGRYSIRQLLWAFYSQHDPVWTTGRFDEAQYFQQLEAKIRHTLALDDRQLSRQQLELVYPLFRCRFWMGRNNAINNRLAPAFTPFIDYSLVQAAVRIPLGYKNHGRFEAQLIERLNPVLAAYPSVYGHHFAQNIPSRVRWKNTLSYHRPAWLRRHSYRLRHRHRSWQPSGLLACNYWQQVLPQGLHYLPQFIKPELVSEPGLWQRLLTLEYLLQYVQAEMPD